jgi:integrase
MTSLRTRNGLPKHCSWNLDRKDGKRRVRFRRGGVSIYLSGTPWSPDFMQQYAAALDGVEVQAGNIGTERTIKGTVNALIVSYYRLVFPTLKPSTQAMRRNILERFRCEHGNKPVARLEHAHVAGMIAAKAKTPEAANNLRKVLRQLLAHAIDINMIALNPVVGVKKFKSAGGGIHTWTEEEVAQFEACHPIGSKPRLALVLMLCTGQRRSDAVRMGWQHVRGDKITVQQAKTGTMLSIPIAADLATELTVVPRTNMTFLLTERGAPFTAAGFGGWFRQCCDNAGLRQCSAHGLRKLAATRLANQGCSEREIMAITGHKSVSEVSRYVQAADQARLAEQAMAKLDKGTDSDSNRVQQKPHFVQKGK